MRTDTNFFNTIAIYIFAQAGVVAHFQIPRCPNAGGWVWMYSLAEFGAK